MLVHFPSARHKMTSTTMTMTSAKRLMPLDGSAFALWPTQLANGVLTFAGDRGNLRIRQDGAVDDKGGNGPWTHFLAEAANEDASAVRIKSLNHAKKFHRDVYLETSDEGNFTSGSTGALFAIVPEGGSCPAPDALGEAALCAAAASLTDEQVTSFVRDGFLVLPGLVPQPLVDDALRAINARLGSGSDAWEADGSGSGERG